MRGTRNQQPLLLLNSNLLKPVVAPLALDYLAGSLQAAGIPTVLADLALEKHPESALRRILGSREFSLVGMSVRNTDDCYFMSRQFFLGRIKRLISIIRALSDAPVVVGGVGYSVFSTAAWEYLGADYGISGDGEEALPRLKAALDGGSLRSVPGLVWRRAGRTFSNLPARARLRLLPPFRREWVDNVRYLREGGMVGFETKRGCPMACIYCADPVAKGRRVRLRPPRAVAGELASLLDAGVDTFHTCDSEFNLPPRHAAAVCREIVRRGLGDNIRWHAYASPSFFTEELAVLMRRAGCVGVNFGVDSGDNRMLARLGRLHRREHIAAAATACRKAGLVTMFDLLIGGPGETAGSVSTTIRFMKRVKPDRVGLACGLRVYPGTPLSRMLNFASSRARDGREEERLLRPVFFISPAIGEDPGRLVLEHIAGDERFFTAGLGASGQDYNYSGHNLLAKAIRKGYRGAFWDILRRLQEDIPPGEQRSLTK